MCIRDSASTGAGAAGNNLAAKTLSTGATTATTYAATAGSSLAAKTLSAASATAAGGSGNGLAAQTLSAGAGCMNFELGGSSRDGGWTVDSGCAEGGVGSDDEFAPIDRT